MASGRFALRAQPQDHALRQHRARLAQNVCQQVLALNEAAMRLSGARDLREARQLVAAMMADRQRQIDALAVEPGHA